MSKNRKGTKMSLDAFNAMPSKSAPAPKAAAWSAVSDMSKVVAKPMPPPPKPIVTIETRVGTQTREFSTLAGGLVRSVSTSRRREQRENTVAPGASTYTSGPWVHIGDTARSHTHPDGAPHTPTAAPGGVAGLTTTPAERQSLDSMPSTTSVSTTVWDP